MTEEPLRIAIVDDSAEDRLEIKAALLRGSTRRYEFHEAATGDDGLLLIRRLTDEGSPPHCIILDVHLPRMDIFEILSGLPREDGQLTMPVVAITGDLQFEQSRALIAAGAQDFVGKSWLTPDSLTRAVDSAIERHALMRALHDREAESRKLMLKLQHAQKMESLGVLAGGIAHDFNNLLVGVLGNAGLALAELPPEAPVRHEIEAIQTAAIRASELTRQLLAYAGRGRFVIGRMSLGRLVDEMGYLLSAVIPKNVLLKYHLAPDLPVVEGDPTQLRQVVMNLITNAADAIGKKSGIITIATSLIHADSGYLADTYLDDSLSPGYYVCLEVSDTGIGMSAETKAKIFDPFYTTKFTGRGLGLAAVLGILRAHKGAVKVYSEVGRGTTFKVLLPAADGLPDLAGPAEPTGAPFTMGGTILVVDDEESIRNVTRRILERAGFKVLTASDGVEGVAVFREHQTEVRAVVLDVTMPRMGGEETFRQLRQLRPEVKVLLSSGYSEQEATSRFAGKGLAGFLEKPFKPQDLIERIRDMLTRD